MKKKVVIPVVLIVGVLVVAGGFVMSKRGRNKAGGTDVRIERLERGELVEFVSAPGEVEPRTKVEISAKVSARIIRLPYKEGDRVTAGDPNAEPLIPPSVLVRLDDKDLESQLKSAEASYAAQAAQIEVEKARIAGQKASLVGLKASCQQAGIDLERQKSLLATQDIPQTTYDQAKLKLDDLLAQCAAAEHSLEAAELNLAVLNHNLEAADARVAQAREALSYTTITSPIDGIITRINAEVGEVVIFGTMNNPGTVIMEVGDLSQMLVVAQVDESDVGKLAEGQRAVVHVDAYSETEFTGKVISIALSHTLSVTRTKYYETEILLDPNEIRLHSGLTAHVDIETTRHRDVLKVPSQAVLGRETDSLPLEIREKDPLVDKTKTFTTICFVYKDGKAIATPVEIGRSDLTHTIIEQGLTEGDKVITGPYKVLDTLHHNKAVRDEMEALKDKKDKASDPDDSNSAPQATDSNSPSDSNEPDAG